MPCELCGDERRPAHVHPHRPEGQRKVCEPCHELISWEEPRRPWPERLRSWFGRFLEERYGWYWDKRLRARPSHPRPTQPPPRKPSQLS